MRVIRNHKVLHVVTGSRVPCDYRGRYIRHRFNLTPLHNQLSSGAAKDMFARGFLTAPTGGNRWV